MPRSLILLGLAALALLALLFATDILDLGDSLQTDPDAPAPWEDSELPGEDPAEAPTLSNAAATKAREAARRATVPGGHDPSEPTGPYSFTVIDAETEAPLEDVVLRDATGERMGATNEDGEWSTMDAGVSRLSFEAVREGYVINRGIASPGRPLEVVLHGGIALEGLVLRAGGDVGVAGASVRVWDLDFGREIASTSTDAKGRFRVRAVRPNHPVTIITTVAGLMPEVRREVFDTLAPEDYIIRVGSGGHVEGRVFSPAGKPVKDMEVWLMPAERKPFAERAQDSRQGGRLRVGTKEVVQARTGVTRTDDEGRYEFKGVPVLRLWQPIAFATGRHFVRGASVRFAEDGEERTIDLTLKASATLALSVKDALGNTMSHAEIRVASLEGLLDILPTDHWKEGVLTLEGLMPGRVHVSALLPGRPPIGASVELRSASTEKVKLVFKAGSVLRGTVKDRKGRAIWKALVRWHVRNPTELVEVRTDERGRFRFEGLQGQEGLLAVSARDLPHTRRTHESWKNEFARPSEGPVHVILKNGTAAIGRFPDLNKGTTVTCRMLAGATPSDWPLGLDEQGGFRRDGPEARSAATFVFYLRGYPPLLVQERTPFHSEETRDLGSLAFEQANPRKGRVLGADSKPIHGAKVSVRGSWSGRATRTDADGDFVFARLPDTRISLRIEAEGYAPANVTLNTTSQFRRQLFTLRRGRAVFVVVLDAAGKPASKAHVVAVIKPRRGARPSLAPQPVHVETDAKGKARMFLPDATYEFTAFTGSEPRQVGRQQVEVKADRKRRSKPIVAQIKMKRMPR